MSNWRQGCGNKRTSISKGMRSTKSSTLEVPDFELPTMSYGCGVEKGYETDGSTLDFLRFCNIHRETRLSTTHACDSPLMAKATVLSALQSAVLLDVSNIKIHSDNQILIRVIITKQ
ncbi:hypothetical protein IGI04_014126 [Brassica rapa subsp. trilocularis]|uniref:RNase H type-1 domain-containing protein n=1 Tax=Brassica rapa subsp. trilocularis TaxID=1813537 RepID=A0ABQ7MLB7_BRACM|nr:hypothetical protein IGI04_014126 [Brassica rapa subsp. trilocularis]